MGMEPSARSASLQESQIPTGAGPRLFADYDNDGWKDLFVTNGYFKDYTNRDFLNYKYDYYAQQARAKEKVDTFMPDGIDDIHAGPQLYF